MYAFAQLDALSEMATPALFGRHYRDDLLGNPAGDDHATIRNVLIDGWLGIRFEGEAPTPSGQRGRRVDPGSQATH